MFSLLKSLFSQSSKEHKVLPESKPNVDSILVESFQKELNNCPYIKSEFHGSVLKHLTHEKSLFKTGNILTTDEKKALGINTRVSFTKELVEVLTDEGLKLQNPKEMINEIYNKVTITKAITDNFNKSIWVGIKKFTLESSGGGDPCNWCISNSGKQFGTDILEKINENCKCHPYTTSSINPVIEF